MDDASVIEQNVERLENMLRFRMEPAFSAEEHVDKLAWGYSSGYNKYVCQPIEGKARLPFLFTYRTESGLIMPPKFDAAAGEYSRVWTEYVVDLEANLETCRRFVRMPDSKPMDMPGILVIMTTSRLEPCDREYVAEFKKNWHGQFDIRQIPESDMRLEPAPGDLRIVRSIDRFNAAYAPRPAASSDSTPSP